MRLLVILLFLCPLSSYAQKSLSQEVFRANVRPQLTAILNDFYQMIALFPDFPKELVSIVNVLDDLHGEKELMREKCPRLLNAKCLDNINNIRVKLALLQSKALEISAHQKISASFHLNAIRGIRSTSDFLPMIDEMKGLLDNSSFMIKGDVPHRRETYEILKQLDELSTLISLSVVEYIPFLYRDDFRHFYFNFIHPIQLQIGKIKNYEFVNQNVNALNFAVNLLNMNLTKRNKKTPEGMGPYLSIIHNRWNSLLRYYY